MADLGIKISQKQADVQSATPSELVYSSKYSNFKILGVATAVLNVPSASPDGIYTVSVASPHDFPAMFMAFVESTTTAPGKWQQATLGDATGTVFVTTDGDAAMPNCQYNSSTGEFDCSISLFNLTPGRTYTFKIVVYIDDLVGSANFSSPATGSYGIKVSKEGFDVLTASDTDLSMSSKFRNLTVAASGIVDGSYPTDPLTVAHGLGYKPIFILFVRDPDTTTEWRYVPTTVTPSAGGVAHVHAYVDSSNLYITPPATSVPVNFRFKYIIFNERFAD